MIESLVENNTEETSSSSGHYSSNLKDLEFYSRTYNMFLEGANTSSKWGLRRVKIELRTFKNREIYTKVIFFHLA